MAELISLLGSIDTNLIKVVGMAISGITGVVVFLLSSKSVNYRRVDKRIVLASVLYFVYLNALSAVLGGVITGATIITAAVSGTDLSTTDLGTRMVFGLPSAVFLAAAIIYIFWGLILKTKMMKMMMTKAKEVSRRTFLLINWIQIVSCILVIPYMPFAFAGQTNLFTDIITFIGWGLTVWWLALIVTFVWRTANYVYSEMKITLTDGEVITYSCSPKMYRVHKHYIRLLRRDEKGKITYERHINEASVQQIEYM